MTELTQAHAAAYIQSAVSDLETVAHWIGADKPELAKALLAECVELSADGASLQPATTTEDAA